MLKNTKDIILKYLDFSDYFGYDLYTTCKRKKTFGKVSARKLGSKTSPLLRCKLLTEIIIPSARV